MLKFLTHKLRTHSLNEDPNQAKADDDHDSGTESDDEFQDGSGIADEPSSPPSCVVCYEAPITHCLTPCGHTCLCETCAVHLKFATKDKRCPKCRERIREIVEVFLEV